MASLGRETVEVIARADDLVVDRRLVVGVDAGELVARGAFGGVEAEVEGQRRVVVGKERRAAAREPARGELRHVEQVGVAALRLPFGEAAGEAAEFEAVEDAVERGGVVGADFELRPVERHVEAGLDGHERLREPRGVGVIRQPLAGALALDIGGVLQERLDRSVLLHEGDGRLLADARHARHVVRRVAHEREHIDELGRL